MTPADILAASLAGLRREGWIKGRMHSPKGHCLLGGVQAAAAVARATPFANQVEAGNVSIVERVYLGGGVDCLNEAYEALNDVILEQFPERVSHDLWSAMAMFNDHPETTFEDVEMVVQKAIRRLEEA